MGIYKDSTNNRTYSGAGVLIVENYYTKNGDIIDCILLVRNKSSQLYTDFGGSFEKRYKTLQNTAYHELNEESLNLFDIKNVIYDISVDIPAGKHFYKMYIIKINGISRKYYQSNRRILDNLHSSDKVPKYWKETDDIVHIPITNIIFDDLNKKMIIKIKDVNGKNVIINRRIKKGLLYAHDYLVDISKIPLTAKRKDLIIVKTNNFTNGTYSFKI